MVRGRCYRLRLSKKVIVTSPLTTVFPPGDRFLDHFDLVTLENPDYYPDGLDLGENYTYTTWLLSPCVKSGQLDCIKCHTSSGRYRFKDEVITNLISDPGRRYRGNWGRVGLEVKI
jgi:hypothetical protein